MERLTKRDGNFVTVGKNQEDFCAARNIAKVRLNAQMFQIGHALI